jgi:ferredoxin-NADP reductase
MKSKILGITNVQSDIFTVHLAKPAGFRYTAGQFVELALTHLESDSRGIRRWFTLSSSPHEPELTITTRLARRDGSSFKKALLAGASGTAVEISEAMGDFVLPKSTVIPVIFVAGGIGITPIHSMLSWLASVHEQRDIRLLWGVKTEEDIIFQDTFRGAGVHATIVVSEPSPSWGGERGRLTAENILGLKPPTDDTLMYMSGPESMLKALEKDLLAHGVQKRQIVTDFFPGYVDF